MSDDRLDMTDTLELLDEVRSLVQSLDGALVNIEVKSKQVNAGKAEISKKLLYASHVADMVRVDIMSQYHRFKGENPPIIVTD